MCVIASPVTYDRATSSVILAVSVSRCLKCRGTHGAPEKATDFKPNFALIDLIELIEKDPEHQQVDERAKLAPCVECAEPSVWYCQTEDLSFCEACKVQLHQSKAGQSHTILPAAGKHLSIIPKCEQHKTNYLEIWCEQCSALCCHMCAHYGVHKDHAGKLPVDDVAPKRREEINNMLSQAKQLASEIETESQTLKKQYSGSDHETCSFRIAARFFCY